MRICILCEFNFEFFILNNILSKSLSYLYGRVMFNDETCVNYLQEENLLPELGSCSKLKDSVICGKNTKKEIV